MWSNSNAVSTTTTLAKILRQKSQRRDSLVSAEHAAEIKVRLYDRLFTVERPDAVRGEDGNYLPFTDFLNPESIKEITAYAEPVAKICRQKAVGSSSVSAIS